MCNPKHISYYYSIICSDVVMFLCDEYPQSVTFWCRIILLLFEGNFFGFGIMMYNF